MYEEKRRKNQKNLNIKSFLNKNNFLEKHPNLKKINWKKLSLQLITFTIFIALVLCTISRLIKYHQNQNIYFEEYINNITNIVLQQEKIFPINIGDSNSLTLEEMIKLQMIENLKENNKHLCDIKNSYVILTKITNKEYRLKTYLKCQKKDKIVESEIECNATCQKK